MFVHTKEFDLGRFSDPSLLILASLASGPKHGYAMMEDIAAFCGTKLETWDALRGPHTPGATRMD